MFSSKFAMWLPVFIVAFILGVWSSSSFASDSVRYGFGDDANLIDISAWDIDVAPDGSGLPDGSGSVRSGADLYAARCAACHGVDGEGSTAARLVGGVGSIGTEKPVRTVGSYWPYATTLFDYIRRAMPHDAPQSLSDDQVYGLVAWLLYKNGIIEREYIMNKKTLLAVDMPNKDGFINILEIGGGPEVFEGRCMMNCVGD